jgi:septal ring factor EnvC (AmiA/AmiB activator)
MNSNNSSNDFQNKLLIEMFTVFVLQLEGNLNIKNNNYQSLDKLRLFEVKSRLDEIMNHIKELKKQNKNVNNLINALKNDNDKLSKEIDEFFK